ncbi:MAG: adenylate kinase [Chloroflexi bacterium]|nr:adenylate kinase [Chloroflexota bacterium]
MSDFPSRIKLGTCINVRGTSGSGKTTFAGDLARILNFRHVELDSLFWGPNWTETPDEVFFTRITEATAGEGWVVDGNYTRARHLYWPRLNTTIFLDYPRWFVMWRVASRTFQRSLGGVELWQGNRESLTNALFSKDSVIRWSWNTYARRRAQFTELEQDPANAHIRFVRFDDPRKAQAWLKSLGLPT